MMYIITMGFIPGTTTNQVQAAIQENVVTYYRITSSSWVVVAYVVAEDIYNIIHPFASWALVVRLNRDRQGWMSEAFWEWMRQNEGDSSEIDQCGSKPS